MEFTFPRDPYDEKKYLRKKSTFEIDPGLTVLVGCNGAGKSTLLKDIKHYAESAKIPMFNFDNLTYDATDRRSLMNTIDDFEYMVSKSFSSEGERTVTRLGDVASQLGYFCLNKHRNADTIFILMDAVGSGTSIDNIVSIRQDLFDTILNNATPSQHIYIIVATNEYEMCRGARCFDVQDCRYREFKTYEQYRKFILKSRVKRDKIG